MSMLNCMTHNARKKYTIALCERFKVLTFGILTCTTFLDIMTFFLYSHTTKNKKKEFKMMTFMLSVCNLFKYYINKKVMQITL